MRLNSDKSALPNPLRRPPARLDFLDGLRGLAALFVVLHHAWLEVWPLWRLPGIWTMRLTGWILYGHYAVDVFIVLSGFCLMLPVVKHGELRGGAIQFFKRRARRILPPYYFAMAFSLLLIAAFIGRHTGTHWDISIPITRRGFLTHLLLIQNWFSQSGSMINHAFWSIAVEWQIYFLFPPLIWLWRKTGGLFSTSVIVAAAYLANWALGPSHQSVTAWYAALFALGVLAAEVAYQNTPVMGRLRAWRGWMWASLVLASAIVSESYHLSWAGASTNWPMLDVVVGLAAAALLIALSGAETHRLRDALSWKPLVTLGTFAYSLYLIHAPLLQVYWQYALHPLHLGTASTFILLVSTGIPLIVGASYLFHIAFERPFMSQPGKPSPKTERQAEIAAAVNPAP